MSERSYASITFYDVNPVHQEEIVSILDHHGFGMYQWPSVRDGAPSGEIPLLGEWLDEECRIGSLHEACEEIVKRFPDAVFWATQAEHYEYTGDVDINEPEHGYFHAETDNLGIIPFSYDHMEQAAQRNPNWTVNDLLLHFRERSGEDNFIAIRKWKDGERQPQYVISESPDSLVHALG